MLKKVLSFVIIISLLSTSAFAINIESESAYLLDYDTENVLYAKNADKMMTPASLTKIMTLYIIYEKMAEGNFTKDTSVPISENAATLSNQSDATNILLFSGDTITIDELIKAMTTVSACACATVISEFISGSEGSFALLMNETAKSLGINAYFTDASGLSDYNLISASSLAKLVKIFIEKYPDILNYTKSPYVNIKGKTYKTTNLLISKERGYFLPDVDGFKTGTTSLAGKCLVSTAIKNGQRLIAVNMKGETNNSRYHDAKELLGHGFWWFSHLNTSIFTTDIRTYINGAEIPCYYFLGKDPSLMMISENLNYYGFFTTYDHENNVLYINEGSSNPPNPLPSGVKVSGEKVFDVYKKDTPKVLLKKGENIIELTKVISIKGQCLISVGEFGRLYSHLWDNEKRSVIITTKN